jgi:hypothetical protein
VTIRYARRLQIRVGERLVDALDCAFEVTRTTDYSQNTARVQIYNLAAETRRDLQSRTGSGVRCTVLAGYSDGSPPSQICDQELRVISNQRSGPDWITSLESGDGDIVKQTAVKGSWAEGASVKGVVQDLVGQLGVRARDLVASLGLVPDKPLDGPLSVSGRGDDSLAQQLDSLGLEHSIQDGELQVVRKSEGTAGEAILLSPATGMVESPELQGIRGFIRVPVVNVRALLTPEITPGVRIRIESTAWSGVCVARRVVHSGTSWGGDWYTDVEGLVTANGT